MVMTIQSAAAFQVGIFRSVCFSFKTSNILFNVIINKKGAHSSLSPAQDDGRTCFMSVYSSKFFSITCRRYAPSVGYRNRASDCIKVQIGNPGFLAHAHIQVAAAGLTLFFQAHIIIIIASASVIFGLVRLGTRQ